MGENTNCATKNVELVNNLVDLVIDGSESLEHKINNALRLLGEYLPSKHVFVTYFRHSTSHYVEEWESSEICRMKDSNSENFIQVAKHFERVKKFNPVFQDSRDWAEGYPHENLPPPFSFLIMPIVIGNTYYGCIGAAHLKQQHDWSNKQILLMKAAGKIILDHIDNNFNKIEMNYYSFHDKLTGLYNRAFFEKSLERLNVTRQHPLSIIISDVNELKLTNDVFGHQKGDDLLIKAAKVLKESLREEDVISRWGGDEFAVLLPQTTMETAKEICKRVHNKCSEASLKQDDLIVPLSISLGASTKESIEETIKETIRKAENSMYENKLFTGKSTRATTIAMLWSELENKSDEYPEHIGRLRYYSEILGKEIGLSADEIEELSLLASYHDIGKIGVPFKSFVHPNKLNQEEKFLIKKHCEIGYRIAKSIPEIAHIAEGILTHHEHWDGNGYPLGLQGEKIPLHSRIISIVDAFVTMTEERPYRKQPLGISEAMAEICHYKETQFDPVIADIFLRTIDSYAEKISSGLQTKKHKERR